MAEHHEMADSTLDNNKQPEDEAVKPDLHQLDLTPSSRTDIGILPTPVSDSIFNNQRVFKKSLPNNKLTLYLINRDLMAHNGRIDKLQGVLLVEPDYVENKRVYGQVTLTFRYGREDEEVMGLKFCTEAMVCFAQLYPPFAESDDQAPITPLQESLVRRLGSNAHAFSMEIPAVAPPSVHLLPAKEYNGAPIGTSYDVKVYAAERADEKIHRNTTVRMGIRVVQRTNLPSVPASNPCLNSPTHKSECTAATMRLAEGENEIVECDGNAVCSQRHISEPPAPHASVDKPFLLSGGVIKLDAKLDRAMYAHGDTIQVHVTVNNDSHKSVKRIQILVLQHVDVCMFNSGKFKNVVAIESEKESCPLGPGSIFSKTYAVKPAMSSTKNWIALEDNYTKAGTTLASTVMCAGITEKDRDPFAINVSYYVKVKLVISLMGGVVSLKLPFALMHRTIEPDLINPPSLAPPSALKTLSIPGQHDKTHVESIACDGKFKSQLVRVNQMATADLIENNDISST